MFLPIQINRETLPALIFGSLLVVVAVGLCIYVWRHRRALQPAIENDERARQHADRQFRRRMQIGVLLALVGIVIPLGDQMGNLFKQRPHLFLVWVLIVFGLVTWMVLMALGDWLSTVAYSSVAIAELRHERRELEEEIRRYHAMRNGNPGNDGHDQFFPGSTQ